MDDVEIIDVNDDGEEMPAVHKPSGLGSTESIRLAAEDLLGEYGWYLLLLAVCVVLLVQYISKRSASASQGNKGVSPQALIVRRQEALEASRRRQQEELDAKAAEFKEKQKKLDEEKRKQKIEKFESMQEGKSYRTKAEEETGSSSTGPKPKSGKKLRGSDYNPLTGDAGAACSWRPGRRGPSSGG